MENKQQNREEIDVFQLFNYLGLVFQKMFSGILRLYNFIFRKRIIILVLLVLGVVGGYFMDKDSFKYKKIKTQVSAQFNSAAYLYLEAKKFNYKIGASNKELLSYLGLTKEEAKSMYLEVKPSVGIREISEEEEVYLTFLEENKYYSAAQKSQALAHSYPYQYVTLYYTEGINAAEIIQKIVAKFRDNAHYKSLFEAQESYINHQLESNLFVLTQIDSLLKTYASDPVKNKQLSGNMTYAENYLNLGNLLNTRSEIQERNQLLITQKTDNTEFLKILSIGGIQNVKTYSLYSSYKLKLPLLLIGLYLIFFLLLKVHYKATTLK